MRLFVALDLPDPILQTLDALTAKLKPAARIQWSTVSKLHITTKFIGEWPESRLGELTSALHAIPRTGPIPIRVEGLGWFPNPHSPRVFLAAIRTDCPSVHDSGRSSNEEAVKNLETLAQATGQATVSLGIPAETRDFHPHVTLARIKTRVDLAPLRQAVAQLESTAFGVFEARSQFLYLSQNSVYTKLEEFPL